MDQFLEWKKWCVETCSSLIMHQAKTLNLDQNYQKVQNKYFSSLTFRKLHYTMIEIHESPQFSLAAWC